VSISKIIRLNKSNYNVIAFLTLFTFSGIARGLQFLLPLLISIFFKSSQQVDYYFYWSSQINLLATLLASIWGSTLVALIIKAKTVLIAKELKSFINFLGKRFFIFAVLASFAAGYLAQFDLLGGQAAGQYSRLLLVGVSTLALSLALALAEIGTAYRRFAIVYKSLLANVITQLSVIFINPEQQAFELALLAGSLAQLISTLFFIRDLKLNTENSTPLELSYPLRNFLPRFSTVALLYLGNFFAAVSSHLSFRIIDDQVGAVSAFAIASMLALAPQQLIVLQLSTVAGVSMAECFQNQKRNIMDASFLKVVGNWRRRLSRLSILSGLLVAYAGMLAVFCINKYFDANSHWLRVSYMTVFLSLPLALSGLNAWVARLNVSVEKISAGVYFQICSNSVLIIMLLSASQIQSAYSSCIALAIFSILQLPALELFANYLLKKKTIN
jgi:hypothetical protein